MDRKGFITSLGFVPKNGTKSIYQKVYAAHDCYTISIDLEKEHIDYGDKIVAESKTTQNFFQPENFVVLECVDRLLRKGYLPQNIVLEKTWRSGHGTSGRLDICVNRDDGSPYLFIECKTYGREFQRELSNIHTDGGQLFTYFQLSGCKADLLMLYASELRNNSFVYCNEIVKIEDDYRSGDVKDIYEKWNKLTKNNGVFEDDVLPYKFKSKALTRRQLKEIKAEDSSYIFNRFLEILRHNVISDKGNAFNKLFSLFLCKVYDETATLEDEQMNFQWIEGVDDYVSFQLRLSNLYVYGMKKFLDRDVSDFNDADFERRCSNLPDSLKEFITKEVNKLRLEKNNEFAFLEVFDADSFLENAKVVKEVVELIQGYRIRYNKRQQYLSDFFELLLTTGLKQEAGQFFTPIPVAQFIIKCLPIDKIVTERLSERNGEILPFMIDYASGSGHFITEYMHEVQNLINSCDESKFIQGTQTAIRNWRTDNFQWANQYVYGIEKDYRLVKVGKVGCYLQGDGLAEVILSDGLANFYRNKDYKGKLRKVVDDGKKDNQQFDILLSNPPYSVYSFRRTTRNFYTENDFELYEALTDNSSEIECLFIERAKQLLKEGGLAGIILPSSILTNSGIYTKAREIILRYFDIVAIAELGSNTFMATNTNTVVLFMRRRDNYFADNTKYAVDTYFHTLNDVTINHIETPVSKYVAHVWNGLEYSDYVTLLRKSPNDKVMAHDIFIEYKKKYSAKTAPEFWETILNIEAEKLLYFIMAYPQQVVIVKSGEKEVEKRFLGYEFSNRRGNEGIHSVQRGKSIDECTQLFDVDRLDNPDKASSYVYQAFCGDFSSQISENMRQHVSRANLIDLLAFDNDSFEKVISLTAKKKVQLTDKFETVSINDIANVIRGITYSKINQSLDETSKIVLTAENITLSGQLEINKKIFLQENFVVDTDKLLRKNDCFICFSSGSKEHVGKVAFINENTNYLAGGFMGIIRTTSDRIVPKYLHIILNCNVFRDIVRMQSSGNNIKNLSASIGQLKIPLPPKDIQDKIVAEINAIEDNVALSKNLILKLENNIEGILYSVVAEPL
ncbi:MAG: N-6 DNA methylase, partial [Prevotella sp.]|nr:N-6 DNA methylase [Prevotella sp.]